MKRLRFEIKCLFIQIKNLILFVSLAVQRGVPVYMWPAAWRGVKADHEARVRKLVFQSRIEGRIRQDADGRLYPNHKGDE
jgi:hypothetical protein